MLQSLVERFTGPRVEAFIERIEKDEKATILEQRKVSAAQKAAAQKNIRSRVVGIPARHRSRGS